VNHAPLRDKSLVLLRVELVSWRHEHQIRGSSGLVQLPTRHAGECMYVCVCMCACVCVCVCVCACAAYASVPVYMGVWSVVRVRQCGMMWRVRIIHSVKSYSHAHICAHMHTSVDTMHSLARTHTHTHAHSHVYIRTRTRTHAHTYTHTHIHTYTHTHIHALLLRCGPTYASSTRTCTANHALSKSTTW
jgi:hypothetical protein